MQKIKTYKNTRNFSQEVLGLSEYEAWLSYFKNRLIKTIVEVRMERGMTQRELANLLETTQSVVSRFESGNAKNLTLEYLMKVLVVLGIEPNKAIKLAA